MANPATTLGILPPPVHRRSARKRDAILAAAHELFTTEGYPGTSMDSMAARANVSKATLYAHFPSKEALYQAVISAWTEDQLRLPDDIALWPVEKGLRFILERFVGMITDPAAMAVYRAVVTNGQRYPEMLQAFRAAGPQAWLSRVSAYLASQHRRGTLYVPVPDLAAPLILHLVKGEPILRALYSGAPCSPFPVETFINEAIRIVLAAYKPLDQP